MSGKLFTGTIDIEEGAVAVLGDHYCIIRFMHGIRGYG